MLEGPRGREPPPVESVAGGYEARGQVEAHPKVRIEDLQAGPPRGGRVAVPPRPQVPTRVVEVALEGRQPRGALELRHRELHHEDPRGISVEEVGPRRCPEEGRPQRGHQGQRRPRRGLGHNQLLWGGVGGVQHAALRAEVDAHAEVGSGSEVAELDLARGSDEEVGGLEVAVDDARGVYPRQPPKDLPHDLLHAPLCVLLRGPRQLLAEKVRLDVLGEA
mmetsp:Transcript_24105/g.75567  ORF Transcript_24105/g.75567 Transcript_24105/m.75567 type:complete len:220 (-) Transcript_24105:1199-1858(-)